LKNTSARSNKKSDAMAAQKKSGKSSIPRGNNFFLHLLRGADKLPPPTSFSIFFHFNYFPFVCEMFRCKAFPLLLMSILLSPPFGSEERASENQTTFEFFAVAMLRGRQ
jgi:hypothetical protein